MLTLAGTATAAFFAGRKGGLGFLTGAAFSMLNFWAWHRLVQRIGTPGTEAGNASILAFALRYFLFAGGLYATIYYFEASLQAALVGIFVAVAAALLEALIELIYGT